ncbi:FLYWCH-type domain-containing protein [Aphis craccivora]|uniref:FLYWCH-type domain-containing protein n=1 Tax=Aphis craccivora TaxID=307492 RepID=A0A6G0ZGZ8_APHCR|nr:FLYWCH-type domain-containing protein [Aphis craccivora]
MYIIKSNKVCDKCWKKSVMKCTGELYTDIQKEDPVSKSNHNHFGDNDKVNVEKVLCVIKEQTKAGLSKSLEVYAEIISSLTMTLEQ